MTLVRLEPAALWSLVKRSTTEPLRSPKIYYQICTKHAQCVSNHYAKFEYKGKKSARVIDNTNQTPPKHFGWKKMSKFNSPKNKKTFIKCAQIGGAHVQFMNNRSAKFEYKGIKTVEVTKYSNQTPSKHFGWKKMSVQHLSHDMFTK